MQRRLEQLTGIIFHIETCTVLKATQTSDKRLKLGRHCVHGKKKGTSSRTETSQIRKNIRASIPLDNDRSRRSSTIKSAVVITRDRNSAVFLPPQIEAREQPCPKTSRQHSQRVHKSYSHSTALDPIRVTRHSGLPTPPADIFDFTPLDRLNARRKLRAKPAPRRATRHSGLTPPPANVFDFTPLDRLNGRRKLGKAARQMIRQNKILGYSDL